MHGMEPHDEIEYWRARATKAEAEAADAKEMMLASEEVSRAYDVMVVYRENERLYAAFAKMVADLEEKGAIEFKATGCEWCGVALPKLDDDTTEMVHERVKRHVEQCSKHPLPELRRALAAVQADSNITLEQRRKAEQDARLAQYACLELARELERTRAERDEVMSILDKMERP
jgi:hypothetical protein